MTTEEMWQFLSNWLDEQPAQERQKIRKLFIRRLRHPEGFNAGVEYGLRALEQENEAARHRPVPRYDSPRCICNAPRAAHAEDGSYSPNGCDMFTPLPS